MILGFAMVLGGGLTPTWVGGLARLVSWVLSLPRPSWNMASHRGLLLGHKLSLYIPMSLGRLFVNALCSISNMLTMCSCFWHSILLFLGILLVHCLNWPEWPSDLDDLTINSWWILTKLNSSLLVLIITINAFNIYLFVLTLKYFLLLLLGTWVLSLITRWRWMTMSINFRALLTFISATWTELDGFLILIP